jgi:hypothetical protein
MPIYCLLDDGIEDDVSSSLWPRLSSFETKMLETSLFRITLTASPTSVSSGKQIKSSSATSLTLLVRPLATVRCCRVMANFITIYQNASVRDAVTLMQSRQIRRLPVVDDNENVIGLITLKTVIGNMPSHNIDLAELESSRAIAETEAVCPYCRSIIRQDGTMAAHMSGTHMQK